MADYSTLIGRVLVVPIMSNKRQYDIKSIIEAIKAVGPHVTKVAKELNCSRSAVYAWRRKYPEVAKAWDGAGGEAVDDSAVQYPREKFLKAIEGCNGILSEVAHSVGCSRQQVYNAFERWPDLKPLFEKSREALVDEAESTVVAMMRQRDDLKVTLNASTYITSRIGKRRGWTERTEVTGADGKNLIELSPEIMELAAAMGISTSKVAEQFENIVRAAAVQKGLVE